MTSYSTKIKDYLAISKSISSFKLRAVDLSPYSIQHKNSQNAFYLRMHAKNFFSMIKPRKKMTYSDCADCPLPCKNGGR